jgi:predicted nucleic acid-binding protein
MILKRPELVIADTSCLILLSKVEALDILPKLYKKIYTTQTVADEFGDTLPIWIIIRNPLTIPPFGIKIDKGEASAIALAIETPDATLIIDELKGRKVAALLKLNYTGTIGVLKRAKREGHIPSLKNLLFKIQETNFRLSQKLIDDTLSEVGEL